MEGGSPLQKKSKIFSSSPQGILGGPPEALWGLKEGPQGPSLLKNPPSPLALKGQGGGRILKEGGAFPSPTTPPGVFALWVNTPKDPALGILSLS